MYLPTCNVYSVKYIHIYIQSNLSLTTTCLIGPACSLKLCNRFPTVFHKTCQKWLPYWCRAPKVNVFFHSLLSVCVVFPHAFCSKKNLVSRVTVTNRFDCIKRQRIYLWHPIKHVLPLWQKQVSPSNTMWTVAVKMRKLKLNQTTENQRRHCNAGMQSTQACTQIHYSGRGGGGEKERNKKLDTEIKI
jgi:hypothetical protein